MRLTTRTRYAMRILVQIALNKGEPTKGREIAKIQYITEPYLEQIMIPLKKAGIVKTVRGCSGGYLLNRAPKDISLLEIIEICEGRIHLSECLGKTNCPVKYRCYLKDIWEYLSEKFRNDSKTISLQDILDKKFESEENL